MRKESPQSNVYDNIVVGNFGSRHSEGRHYEDLESSIEWLPGSAINQFTLDSLVDTWKPLSARSYLFRQGDKFRGVFFVRSGAVKSLHIRVSGQEQITTFHLPGDLIGFDGFQSGFYSTSAVTLETTSLWFLPQKYLLSGNPEHYQLDQHLMLKLSEIQNRQSCLSMTLARNRADERIAAFLWDLSNRFDNRNFSPVEFRLPMNRTDLGSYLGLTGETICRAFQAMEKTGMVKCAGRDIKIEDYSALASLAGAMVPNNLPAGERR